MGFRAQYCKWIRLSDPRLAGSVRDCCRTDAALVVCVSERMLLGLLHEEEAEHLDEQLGATSADQIMPSSGVVSRVCREVGAFPVCRVFSGEACEYAPARWIATGRYKTICAYRYSSPPRSRSEL